MSAFGSRRLGREKTVNCSDTSFHGSPGLAAGFTTSGNGDDRSATSSDDDGDGDNSRNDDDDGDNTCSEPSNENRSR